ncbi:MAG: argininosuccinate lyase [Candidatus Firestonebacteria bacterium]
MKLWGGRFKKELNPEVKRFTSSIYFDNRLVKYDIKGSIAHVMMLGKCNIIPMKDAGKIILALNKILGKIKSGKFKVDYSCEDIHTNIEKEVIKMIGDLGKKMHTARSRNDQIALDERMYLKDEILDIINSIENLDKSLKNFANKYKNLIIPGFTHLQHAQPVKFSDYISAYTTMLNRDTDRFKDLFKRVDVMPLGACALAGTSLPINRKYVAKLLKFSKISTNNIDAVSDRDYIIEFIGVSSILFIHLSRLSEEMVLWSTKEFNFINIDDAYTTGSSLMPQKKNPDVFELVRGKTGRIFGRLIGILTVMKGLPLAYDSDMQEDKVHLFDVVDTTKECLDILTNIFKNIVVNLDSIKKSINKDYSDAVEVANYLVKKGVNFREAHTVVGKIILYCLDKNIGLKDLSLKEYKNFSKLFKEDIFKI